MVLENLTLLVKIFVFNLCYFNFFLNNPSIQANFFNFYQIINYHQIFMINYRFFKFLNNHLYSIINFTNLHQYSNHL